MKNRLKCMQRILASLVFLSSIAFAQEGKAPKNVILFIGDGMGIAHVTAGRTYKGWLELDAFKHIGLMLTHGASPYYVTESAAGGTALAIGQKTYGGILTLGDSIGPRTFVNEFKGSSGAVGMNADSQSVPNLLEVARKRGKRTGVVTICHIVDATPAAFLAHVPTRRMTFEIAEQIANSSADVILGGGWNYFLPTEQGGVRPDGKNLIDVMKRLGYTYVATEDEFRNVDGTTTEKLLGLFARHHMGYAPERSPRLVDMTRTAIEIVSRGELGFVLVIENEAIDDAAHASLSDKVMIEVAEMDDAVGEALRFARQDGQTLVLVTADHETGGYALTHGSLEERWVHGSFSTRDHTATMVPIFAFGPGAELFAGIIENAEVGKRLQRLVGETANELE
jgi:alkaline phosphatase